MKKLTLICIAALCAVVLLSACGLNGSEDMMTPPPAVTDDLVPEHSDGIVKDGDGVIGNEHTSDPAGDAVTGQSVPDATVPESAVPSPEAKSGK